MSDPRYFFTLDDHGHYTPAQIARGRWAHDTLGGPAVVGVAARALEVEFGDAEFTPARLTVDLFKAAKTEPLQVQTRTVRAGRRIRTHEADLRQGDVLVAHATLIQLRRADAPPGTEWHSRHEFTPPVDDHTAPRWFGSDAVGWTPDIRNHQNASRKRMWSRVIDVVEGERNSPFVDVVVAAEATSLMTNWGDDGIGYINCDLTVALTRLPAGDHVGVQADTHLTADGIAVGTATLFDRSGPVGTALVTAVSNAAAQIDFSR
ncbi:acyl-CoA thioesterase domain-containing protein [Williamsia sp. CHRR-6]|uniref:acyl-CoA thioesterase domain-containing protein n=1 Tax=Williamsia sp. CHRR-6 TaxID=2835871 RepID=UPI001BDB31C7|nr:acyl-CoA thioesterase domain-containing protein [Williamsia sp. CHRR-6]MBT0567441.1 thioesterase family protein [Williamsia sp. CHRR-6]